MNFQSTVGACRVGSQPTATPHHGWVAATERSEVDGCIFIFIAANNYCKACPHKALSQRRCVRLLSDHFTESCQPQSEAFFVKIAFFPCKHT